MKDKNKIIGIVIGMKEEADQVVETLGLELDENWTAHGVVEGNTVILMCSGVGKVNAQNAAWKLVSLGAEVLLNVGGCGTNNREREHTWVFPNIFYDGDFEILDKEVGPTQDPAKVNWILTNKLGMEFKVPEVCYTYSSFRNISDSKDWLIGSIIDMDAYGIVSVARTVDIPIVVMKYVVGETLGIDCEMVRTVIRDFDRINGKNHLIKDSYE